MLQVCWPKIRFWPEKRWTVWKTQLIFFSSYLSPFLCDFDLNTYGNPSVPTKRSFLPSACLFHPIIADPCVCPVKSVPGQFPAQNEGHTAVSSAMFDSHLIVPALLCVPALVFSCPSTERAPITAGGRCICRHPPPPTPLPTLLLPPSSYSWSLTSTTIDLPQHTHMCVEIEQPRRSSSLQ